MSCEVTPDRTRFCQKEKQQTNKKLVKKIKTVAIITTAMQILHTEHTIKELKVEFFF